MTTGFPFCTAIVANSCQIFAKISPLFYAKPHKVNINQEDLLHCYICNHWFLPSPRSIEHLTNDSQNNFSLGSHSTKHIRHLFLFEARCVSELLLSDLAQMHNSLMLNFIEQTHTCTDQNQDAQTLDTSISSMKTSVVCGAWAHVVLELLGCFSLKSFQCIHGSAIWAELGWNRINVNLFPPLT